MHCKVSSRYFVHTCKLLISVVTNLDYPYYHSLCFTDRKLVRKILLCSYYNSVNWHLFQDSHRFLKKSNN